MVPDDPDAPRERARALALVAAAVSLAVALRAHALGALSLYYDELYATRIYGVSPRNLAGVVARTAFYDQHPPLYYLTALVWTRLFGLTEVGVRSLSVTCGVLLVPAVYDLGRVLSGRRVGAVAALLTAGFPLLVYYAREARMYAMLALLATLTTAAFVRLAQRHPSRHVAPAFALLATATALTHYFGAVHVAALFVTLLWRGRAGLRALPSWLSRFALPGALFVPFAAFARYQAGHFDSSYLGFGARVYADVLAWIGGAHQSLPAALAWTLPLVALAVWGARASWRETGPVTVAPFAAPSPTSTASRALAVLTSLGALAVAAGVVAVRAKLLHKIAQVEIDRGESFDLATLQAQTAVTATLAGAVAVAVAGALWALGDRLAPSVDEPTDDPRVDPARSLPRVALACIAVPLALSVIAGLAGKPLVLVRNFVIAAPFVALLAARGWWSLARSSRPAAALAVAFVMLFSSAQFGALPALAPQGDDLRPWLLHTYQDWRGALALARGDTYGPVVVAQHYATDAAIHYRAHHPVLRVREDGERLVVSQVRQDDDFDVEVHEGDAFHPELLARFYLVDVQGLARDHGLSRRLLDSARASHECAVVGRAVGHVTVYDCNATSAVALAR